MPPCLELLRKAAEPLTGSAGDFDSLVERIGNARIVLLGEATHGTHEFYHERARISKRLIAERGFRAIAVEADWPDAYRVNRFVCGAGSDGDAEESLQGFKRFPQWMWRNADVLDFVGWLREYNEAHRGRECGFYGLDLYSLHASIEAVLAYLDKVDPAAAKQARRDYSCFDHFSQSMQTYGWATEFGLARSCENEVVRELLALRAKAEEYLRRDGEVAASAYFSAEQNALLVRDAEQYYRTLFHRGRSSWNLRDTHMMNSLEILARYLERKGVPSKIIVWAHNSHLGDARATEMAQRGELNLGQLAHAHFGDQALSIGFTTHAGTVTAASNWDEPAERKTIRPSLPGSYERMFHELGIPRFWIDFQRHPEAAAELSPTALERAIGVIYLPETERVSHYFEASLADQFDGVIHIDHTRAVEPLERTVKWRLGEPEETYPTGI
jgi:erythromycin esterase-like protein